jgi:replication factor A1
MVTYQKLIAHIDDIYNALNQRVDRQIIEADLKKALKTGLSIADAKHNIVSKHGGDVSALKLPTEFALAELTGDEENIDFTCRVIDAEKGEIVQKDRKIKVIRGIIGDRTATIPYVVWRPDLISVEKGDVIAVKNAKTKLRYNRVEVYFTPPKTKISKLSQDILPDDAIPVKEPVKVQIKDFKDGMYGVATTVKILSISEKEVSVGGIKKTVYTGLIADSTAKTHFTAWCDFNLHAGDVIKVTNGYLKSWRGVPHLTIDERSKVEKYEGIFEVIEESKTIAIADLLSKKGGVDVMVECIPITVREGSGLVFKCPVCKKTIDRDVCSQHGDVKSIADLKIRVVVDDGTAAMTAFFSRTQAEALLKMSVDECIELVRERMTRAVITEKIESKLLAMPIRIRGNVVSDAYGLSMFVTNFEFVKKDVKAEATALLSDFIGELSIPEGE